MPARLPDDVIYRIQLRLECGESPVEIHKATKVSISTIQRVRLNLDLFSQPYTPSTVVLRRPKALLPAQELVMSILTLYSIKFKANNAIAIACLLRR
jgi:hypothetical protein